MQPYLWVPVGADNAVIYTGTGKKVYSVSHLSKLALIPDPFGQTGTRSIALVASSAYGYVQFVDGNRQTLDTTYNGIYTISTSYTGYGTDGAPLIDEYVVYPNRNAALDAMNDGIWDIPTYTITYRNTNCSAPSAPTEAAVGDIVTVIYEFPDGYGIVNSGDIYVTNNGVVIPSEYANGVLTFTMPDPSQ